MYPFSFAADFCNFVQLEEDLEVEGRHGSASSKIIPWSVSWHPMIVRQRLESVGLSLGVHVRLARVSCGATLPIPGCLQDCNIVSGRGRVSGGTGRGREGEVGYITIHTLALFCLVSHILSLVLTHVSRCSFLLVIYSPSSAYSLCSWNGVLWR